MNKYRNLFLEEAAEQLGEMSRGLLELEKSPASSESIEVIFRMAHSIKSMAASLGYESITELAHRLEDRMEGIRSAGAVGSAEETALLFRGLERVSPLELARKVQGKLLDVRNGPSRTTWTGWIFGRGEGVSWSRPAADWPFIAALPGGRAPVVSVSMALEKNCAALTPGNGARSSAMGQKPGIPGGVPITHALPMASVPSAEKRPEITMRSSIAMR